MTTWGVLRNPGFTLYCGGTIMSQIGTRGTVTASLYQIYEISRSLARVFHGDGFEASGRA